MRAAMDETDRRRIVQAEFNREHGIVPRSVTKAVGDPIVRMAEAAYYAVPKIEEEASGYGNAAEIRREVEALRKRMREAAGRLDFEAASELRDKAKRLEEAELGIDG